MCRQHPPLTVALLQALRLAARAPEDRKAELDLWLCAAGLAPAGPTIENLARLLAGDRQRKGFLGAPGEAGLRPGERALFEALACIDHDPERAERLAAFMHPAQRMRVLALMSDLGRQLAASAALRVRLGSDADAHAPDSQAWSPNGTESGRA